LASPAPPALSSAKEFRVGYQKGGISASPRTRARSSNGSKALGVEGVKWVEFQFGPPLLEALGLARSTSARVGDTPPIFAQAAGAKVVYVA